MNSLNSIITAVIKELSSHRGLILDANEAALKLGVSRRTLYRYADDPTNPRVERIKITDNTPYKFYIPPTEWK